MMGLENARGGRSGYLALGLSEADKRRADAEGVNNLPKLCRMDELAAAGRQAGHATP